MQSKHKLRDYEMRLDREVKECVVAELSAHSTVQYMRDLEELYKSADNKAYVQDAYLSRVAYEAQKQNRRFREVCTAVSLVTRASA